MMERITVEILIEKLQKVNPKAIVCKPLMFEYIPIEHIFEIINAEYVIGEEKIKSDLLVIR